MNSEKPLELISLLRGPSLSLQAMRSRAGSGPCHINRSRGEGREASQGRYAQALSCRPEGKGRSLLRLCLRPVLRRASDLSSRPAGIHPRCAGPSGFHRVPSQLSIAPSHSFRAGIGRPQHSRSVLIDGPLRISLSGQTRRGKELSRRIMLPASPKWLGQRSAAVDQARHGLKPGIIHLSFNQTHRASTVPTALHRTTLPVFLDRRPTL